MKDESGLKRASHHPKSPLRLDCTAHSDRIAAVDLNRNRADNASTRIAKTLRL
jgi:hypothetical protein